MSNHKFSYRWTLADANFTKDKGKVFSCFACGGGSTMGYKLAGFDVIGDNEIDPKINELYVMNHHPKYNYLCDIRELVQKAKDKDLPDEMYALDILDASPPCSSFSMSGNREQDWGKEKQFREGQKKQVLDTLFFDTIDLVNELRPKVSICENVKGIISGKAIEYTNKIHKEFDKIGYYCEHYLVRAEQMGVPQKRPRVVFVAVRKDLAEQYGLVVDKNLFEQGVELNMVFNEDRVLYGEIADDDDKFNPLSKKCLEAWNLKIDGDTLLSDACERNFNVRKFFDACIAYKDKVCPTLTAHQESVVPFHKPSFLSYDETLLASSFPLDYKFVKPKQCVYVCGMSVPPILMANVASRVYEQILSKMR